METFVRIWGTSLILLGVFALLNPTFEDIPVMFVSFWGVLAIGLGIASFWLKHPALLLTYAVFIGAQGLLMAIGWFAQGPGGDPLVVAVAVALLFYGVRLANEFRRARHIPAGPADAFAYSAIAAALMGALLGVVVMAAGATFFLVNWLYLAITALGMSLGALLTHTERPGLAKIGVGLSLLTLIAFVGVLALIARGPSQLG
jgi:hypothetical protein